MSFAICKIRVVKFLTGLPSGFFMATSVFLVIVGIFLIPLLLSPSCMNSFQEDHICGLSSQQRGQLPREPSKCQSSIHIIVEGSVLHWHADSFQITRPVFVISDSTSIAPNHFCCPLPVLFPFSLVKWKPGPFVSVHIAYGDLVRKFPLQETNVNIYTLTCLLFFFFLLHANTFRWDGNVIF